jgi:aminoglycoside phosphotransferase (APT) family kinase protein
MPHCLVHADFVNKNVLVAKRHRDQLMALDWGIAGWGAPARTSNTSARIRTTP